MPKSVEFILQPHLPSVVLVEPFGPHFGAIANKLAQDPALQVVECISAMDTLSIVRQMSACVILGHATTPAEINQHITILKTLASQIQQKQNVRMVITVSPLLPSELVEKLSLYGCAEILSESTPASVILFKLERHLKALPKLLDAELDAGGVRRPNLRCLVDEGPAPPPGVRLMPTIDLPQDHWSLSGGGARLTSGAAPSWTVKLRGPSAEEGRWQRVSGKDDEWQWHLDGSRTGWFACSDFKPLHVHGFWAFVGARPWLAYVAKGKPTGYKFRINEKGSLLIARDSATALGWLSHLNVGIAQEVEAPQASVAAARPEIGTRPAVSQVVLVDPLLIASDYWLRDRVQPRLVGARWLVQLVGPGPSVGRWVEAPGTDRSKTGQKWADSPEKWWRWVPDAGLHDPFTFELGSWYCFGLAPNFTQGVWLFVSSAPELGFYFDGSCYGNKLSQRGDGSIELARDSEAGLDLLPLIRQSFDHQVAPRSKRAPSLGSPVAPPTGPAVPSDDPRGNREQRGSAELAPFAPTLSGLALIVLASELIARRSGTLRERCDQYCSYLMASLGGVRVEIWAQIPGAQAWACVGASDARAPQFEALARKGSGLSQINGMPARVTEICPGIEFPIGLLILSGHGAQQIEVLYARAAARAVVGLVLGAQEELSVRSAPVAEVA